jgi:hypothetical protein
MSTSRVTIDLFSGRPNHSADPLVTATSTTCARCRLPNRSSAGGHPVSPPTCRDRPAIPPCRPWDKARRDHRLDKPPLVARQCHDEENSRPHGRYRLTGARRQCGA